MTKMAFYRCDRCGSAGTIEEFEQDAWVEMKLFPEGGEFDTATRHLCPPCNTTLHHGFFANTEAIAVTSPRRFLDFGETQAIEEVTR